jgi:hypothetical protein
VSLSRSPTQYGSHPHHKPKSKSGCFCSARHLLRRNSHVALPCTSVPLPLALGCDTFPAASSVSPLQSPPPKHTPAHHGTRPPVCKLLVQLCSTVLQYLGPGLVVAGLYGPEGSRLYCIGCTVQLCQYCTVRLAGWLHACGAREGCGEGE